MTASLAPAGDTHRRFHVDRTTPANGEVFVFGSNLAGRHGKGAAELARKRYGAVPGRGVGRMGHCYGIPTKNDAPRPEPLLTLPLDVIARHVDDFLAHAKATPGVSYFVTRVGCGLADYQDDQIAPMFAGAPSNCSFAQEWRPYLDAPAPRRTPRKRLP